ncbi:hypothetical protein HDU76_013293 [Blyttiomyces sp. JEL0837]|nr:hypothetical protein HDU76_013293 [Blyttiomyces sp. JEL0837]
MDILSSFGSGSGNDTGSSNSNIDNDAGHALNTFYSTLVFNIVLASVFFIIFMMLRPRFPKIYSPKTTMATSKQRPPPLSASPFSVFQVLTFSDATLLKVSGHDAVAAVFFVRIVMQLFACLAVLSWILLIPIHATGGNAKEGLDQFTFSNILDGPDKRLWAHLVMTAAVSGLTVYTIFQIVGRASGLTRNYQGAPHRDTNLQVRTLLIRDIPKSIRSPIYIRQLLERVCPPGSVHAVIFPHKISKELIDLAKKRLKIRNQLEGAISGYFAKAAKLTHIGAEPVYVHEDNEFYHGKKGRSSSDFLDDGDTPHVPTPSTTGEIWRGEFEEKGWIVAGGQSHNGGDVPPVPSYRPSKLASKPTQETLVSGLTVESSDEVSVSATGTAYKERSGTVTSNTTFDGAIQQHDANFGSDTGAPDDVVLPHVGTGVSQKAKKVLGDELEERSPVPAGVDEKTAATLRKRPTRRTGTLGLVGPKEDAIRYGASTLRETEKKIAKCLVEGHVLDAVDLDSEGVLGAGGDADDSDLEMDIEQGKNGGKNGGKGGKKSGRDQVMPIAFVVFNDVLGPHVASRITLHDAPAIMSERYPCVDVKDVIWENAQAKYIERQIRNSFAVAVVTALVIFWSLLIAFVTGVADLDNVKKNFPPIAAPLLALPTPIYGLIAGLLPAIIVSVLISLVPTFLRLISFYSGSLLKSETEKTIHGQYFAFQVFNVLVISVVSSSIFTSYKSIVNNPSNALEEFAGAVPKLSNFFINFLMLQGLSAPAQEVAQIVPLFLKPILAKILGTTPRAAFAATQPPAFDPSVMMASHAFIVTVGLFYSVISPLVLPFAVIYFALFFVVYKYEMMYLFSHPAQTGGKMLYRAAKHMFTGLFMFQGLMLVLFGLKQAIGQAILTLIFTITTYWASRQVVLFEKVINTLPVKTVLDAESDRKLKDVLPTKQTFFSFLLPGLMIAMPDEDVATPTNSPSTNEHPMSPLSPAGTTATSGFKMPSHAELISHFAHPMAASQPIHVWVPDVGVKEVLEAVRSDFGQADGEVDASFRVVTTSGAAVNAKGEIVLAEKVELVE